MKICIFGTGGIGGYFGGRLAQSGQDVTFIARGKHLEAILTDGLRIKSIDGDATIQPAKTTDQPDKIGEVDLIFCCVKSWQVTDAAEAMRPMVGPETVVIPLQNGVEAHTMLSDVLGVHHVLPGLCKIIAMVESPGHIRHTGADPLLVFGEMDGQTGTRTQTIARLFDNAQGVTAHLSGNIIAQLWKKFMLIAPWSGLGAVTRSPIGVIRSLPETRTMLIEAIREVYAVARGNKIALEEKSVEDTLSFIDALPAQGTASMQRDIINGRPSELEAQSGAVVRYGEKSGVPTPVNRLIYASLLPQEGQARGE